MTLIFFVARQIMETAKASTTAHTAMPVHAVMVTRNRSLLLLPNWESMAVSSASMETIAEAKCSTLAADITGLILTKLDGTAKGGIVFSIKKELDIPVKFIGVGEKYDDMQSFDAKQFVDALFEA